MKLNNGEIVNAKAPLAKLLKERFPIRVSYSLAKVVQAMKDQTATVEKLKDGLIKNHGTPLKDMPSLYEILEVIDKTDDDGNVLTDKAGKPIRQDNPDYPIFVEEMMELLDEETEIDFGATKVPVKIPEKVATTCDKCHHNMDREIEIEPEILLALDKFVTIA